MKTSDDRGRKSPQGRASVSGLTPYAQGKSEIAGHSMPIKLSSNESAYGTSPHAVAAFKAASETLFRYPDGAQTALRRAIAEVHQLPFAQLVCGNGSEELIGLLTRCYVQSGDEVLLTQNHFVMCPIYARAQGAEVVLAPETHDYVDVDALLACITPRTRLVIVANPNNPTGTYIPESEVARLVRALPPSVLCIIDGAYAEYVLEADYSAGAEFVHTHPNVVMTRTFSKIYGLAGLRIGWMFADPSVIDMVNRLRTPFNTNAAALAAATAAIRDTQFVEAAASRNRAALAVILPALQAMGLRVTPSVANFYLIDFNGIAPAAEVIAWLEADGIIPRPGGSNTHVRITVGTESENARVLESLRALVAQRRGGVAS